MFLFLKQTPTRAGSYVRSLNFAHFGSDTSKEMLPGPLSVWMWRIRTVLQRVLYWYHSNGASEWKMMSLLAGQCSYVTGQRLRRGLQIGQLYNNIYSEKSRKSLFISFLRRFQSRHLKTFRLVAAIAGVFMWEEERIKEEELHRCTEDIKNIHKLLQTDSQERNESITVSWDQQWEIVMDKKRFKLWRQPIAGTHLYRYRVFGTYTDVTPRQFFNVQLDTEYRKKWDSLVIKLEVIDRDEATGSEVIHWVTYFPYPMFSRDYVYVRRYYVDQENNVMVLVSRAVEHPKVPESSEFVRVRTYQSQMVIRPHSSFDENGFDYLLTYSDNPQTVFPRYCVSWMVSSGMPDFLEKLHMAALKAKKMEIKVKDYMSSRSKDHADLKPTQNSERDSDANCSPQPVEYA
ncbi:stAR-related lipid transfer protein 7, mitochondrial [Protopterus annectens]|uniref:stAR-related lipid transfer protein 7, mitochondrial n=1 Tax=Protopterus annectens TaxID=7888 RepID=UPI001CF9BE68|nr:stAR-related lipid transfer protein 7, mitochondrial [Protopterus annectens]